MLQIRITTPKWNIESETGYKPKTTFWQDFSIADKFGLPAVVDTFNRAFNEWKNNVVYITELVLVLNHKIWQFYQTDKPLSQFYNKAYSQAYDYALDNLKGAELDYFYRMTD